MHQLEFDAATVPWVDRPDFEENLASRLKSGRLSAAEAELLERWHRDGYLALPGLLDADLIDRLVAEHDDIWTRQRPVKALVEGHGVKLLSELPPRDEFDHHHYRLMDVQDVSKVAREVILHPRIIGFLRHLFRRPVAMQSLFFEYGSEQAIHQDFPYVQSQILSHLVGCWIACDDVTAESGPLFYYPGSHRLPKFDWGDESLVFNGEDESQVEEYGDWLQRTCTDAGLESTTFHAQER